MKNIPHLHMLLAATLAGGAFSAVLAQTAPATTPAAAAAPASSAARPARAVPAQKVGGIQADSSQTSRKFFFGTGDAPSGYTKITPTTTYSDATGYGFEKGPVMNIVSKTEPGKEPVNIATNDKQFFFSTALPEGNYKVTVTLGNPDVATDVSVKAELRRLMLENIKTKPGEYITKTFIVNTRRPEYADGAVNLKAPRESQQEAWDWDKGLTLEFIGDHPSISNLQIEKADVPTVYIVGDSTSCDQMVEPYNSWGQSITRFFQPDIAVANHGESGETFADSLSRHRFDKVWSMMKPGDYLFVQFGHNDMKAPGTVEGYRNAIQRVVDGTKKTGGTLVIVTPMNRHTFSGNTVTNSLQGYPYAAWEMAKNNGVACVELNGMSKTLYEYFGPEASQALFAQTGPTTHDGTHHSDFGSYELAKCVLVGVQQAKLDLAKHIVDGFSFDPAKPDKPEDFKVAPTPKPTNELDKPPGS
jgi:lysophospholipase L1-like esterase